MVTLAGVVGAFRCEACALELADGVDYTWCPKCGGPVTATGAPVTVSDTAPSPWQVARVVLGVAVVVQAALALADPHGFPYLAPLVVVALVAAVPAVIATVVLVPAVRALVRDPRIRILHGLEHATINVLEQRGIPVCSGVTIRVRGRGLFDLAFVNDGTNAEHVAAIRGATLEAIRRLRGGEHALAYDPRCGTSYLVGRLVVVLATAAAATLALALGAPYGYAYVGIVVAMLLAWRGARPLGLAAQRAFTVSHRFASARVDAVERDVSPRGSLVYYAVHMTVEPIASADIGEPI
jgi:hypothetical protein